MAACNPELGALPTDAPAADVATTPAKARAASIAAAQASAGPEFEATTHGHTAFVRNPVHQLRGSVEPRGLMLHDDASSRAPAWQAAVTIAGYGCGDALTSVAPGRVTARGNRIDHGHGPLTAWYRNGPHGLQQNFTLTEPPACLAERGTATVALEVDGLTPHARDAGTWISLTDRSHREVLRYVDLYVEDAHGRPLAASMRVNGSTMLIDVAAAGAAFPIEIDPTYTFQQKLLPTTAGAALLGHAVAIDGDTLVAGASVDSQAGTEAGAAYVFVRSGGTWATQQKLVAGDAAANDRFGKSIDISGETLVVGTPLDDAQRGSAYVFVRSGTTWSLQQKLQAPDGVAGDRFAQTVRIDGDTLVASGYLDDDLGADAGAAYVFVRSGTTWALQQKLTSADQAAGDHYGYFVDVAGDTVVVGARMNDDGATDAGAAYIFVRSGVTWTQQQKLTASDPTANSRFGRAVSISGETVLVGAWAKAAGTGAAYVFVRSGATWTQQQKLTASDATSGDEYGKAVVVRGDIAVVAGYKDDVGFNDQGSVYVYSRTGSVWTQDQKISAVDPAADDRFGQHLALSASTLVVGNHLDDNAQGANAGSVHTFVLPEPTLAPTPMTFDFGDLRVGQTSAAQSITLQNVGAAPLTISSFTAAPPFAVTGPATPIVVPPAGNAIISTTFAPTALGLASGAITIVSDDANSPMLVPLTGTGVAPAISIAPTSLAFGGQRVGTTGSLTVDLTNTGTDTLAITAITAGGAFASTDMLPINLPPAATATLTVTFTPTALGPFMDDLTIVSDAPTGPTVVPLIGAGVEPAIAIEPISLAFGDHRVGTTGILAVDVTNTGTDALTISSLSFGSAGSPFAAPDPTPIVILPGMTAPVTVTFTPTALGPFMDDLTIVSDAPAGTTVVPLTGAGVEPAISVNPTAVAFGPQPVGGSAIRMIDVTNTGTDMLAISAVTCDGAAFTSVDTVPITVLPGATTTLTVAFSPSATGAFMADLTIVSDAPTSPTVVPLTGTGGAPAIMASTSTLAFGTVKTGTPSAVQTVTLTNTGDAPTVITAAVALPPFLVSGPPLPAGLLPTESLTFSVTFLPMVDGAAFESLVFATETAAETTIALSGTGGSPILDATPIQIDFGAVEVGQVSAPTPITIQNLGVAPLEVFALVVSGPFVASPLSPPAVIPPGGVLSVEARFRPVVGGESLGSIVIESDAGPRTIPVVGTGTMTEPGPVIGEIPSRGCATGGDRSPPSLLGLIVLGLIVRRRRGQATHLDRRS